MSEMGRGWRVLAGGIGACAAGVAGVLGIAGTTASAQPLPVQPTLPAPATVTQTVTVAPNAAAVQPGVTPATAGVAAVPAEGLLQNCFQPARDCSFLLAVLSESLGP